jgi:hypothetical protein
MAKSNKATSAGRRPESRVSKGKTNRASMLADHRGYQVWAKRNWTAWAGR